MKKLIIIISLFIIALIGIQFGIRTAAQIKNSFNQIPQSQSNNIPTAVPQNTAETPGTPQSIRIPKIGVDAPVEQVGLDSQSRMDVPHNSDNAGWYSLGYKPGENGNAVIDGHLDKVSGAPAIFWNIAELQAGDQIIITDSKGKDYTFTVTNTQSYPYNDFPLQEVFGASTQPMLNLITCRGVWDAASKNYSQREVIYAKLSQ